MSVVTVQSPRPSLLKLLTLPFLAVILLLALVVGGLSYRAAAAVAEEAWRLALVASVQRVGDALERQRLEADAVLRAAFPEGEGPPAGTDGLVPRWSDALTLHPLSVAELRYATAAGQSVALRRLPGNDMRLTVQRSATAAPDIVHVSPPGGASGPPPAAAATAGAASAAPATDVRETAWYRAGQVATSASWLPLAFDVLESGPSRIRVRRVDDATGQAAGVAAVDVSLQPLEALLRGLELPPRGVAIVADDGGRVVLQRAASTTGGGHRGDRLTAAGDELVALPAATLVAQLLPRLAQSTPSQPASAWVELPDGGPMLAAFARLGAADDAAPWTVIVAAARDDMTTGLRVNAAHTAAAALVAAAAVLVAGAWVRRRIAGDAHELVDAARRIGDGDLDTPPAPMATAELGALRDALRRMQLRLRTDRVTGLANRESVLTRLHDRMRPGRRHNDAPLLALLFVDLDRFKSVNDRHGHDAGDLVLQTIGRRLRQTVRDTDLVARWSGDEFVLLLDGVGTPGNAERVRDQVERVLRDPVELGPGRDAVELEGTVGLALSGGDTPEPESLIRAAEDDMLRRKPSSLSQW